MNRTKQKSRELEIVHSIRGFIEQGWCQRAMARDGAGKVTHESSPSARAWCLTGAFLRATNGKTDSRTLPVYNVICDVAGTECLVEWNDQPGRTKDDVLQVLARAEAMLASE